ncbi:MAG TPA: hypothetical protein VHH73_15425, partial [Verrucomicrobiae bacterium]|nr:hypothetical protein [Verrucomicrobiae bacterium]
MIGPSWKGANRRAGLDCLWLFLLCMALISSAGEWVTRTIAGTGQPGYSGDAGPAAAAQLNNPYGLVKASDGALYICDMENQVIRRIGPDGVITTVAGSGKRGYSGDGGPATRAELNEPYEVRLDATDNLYFVEMKNAVVRR